MLFDHEVVLELNQIKYSDFSFYYFSYHVLF